MKYMMFVVVDPDAAAEAEPSRPERRLLQRRLGELQER